MDSIEPILTTTTLESLFSTYANTLTCLESGNLTRMNVNSFQDREYATPCQALAKHFQVLPSIAEHCQALTSIAGHCQGL